VNLILVYESYDGDVIQGTPHSPNASFAYHKALARATNWDTVPAVCRVASRNFVTGASSRMLPTHIADAVEDTFRVWLPASAMSPWTALLAPFSHPLLQGVELPQAITSRVASLELDKKLERSLVRIFLQSLTQVCEVRARQDRHSRSGMAQGRGSGAVGP
jgi:hypothetical protein